MGRRRKHEDKIPPILGCDTSELEHWGTMHNHFDSSLEGVCTLPMFLQAACLATSSHMPSDIVAKALPALVWLHLSFP